MLNEYYISRLAPEQREDERKFYIDKKRREDSIDIVFAYREKEKKKRVLKFTSNSRLIWIYLTRRKTARRFIRWKKRNQVHYDKFYKDYKIQWRLVQLRHFWEENKLWRFFNEGSLFFLIILFFSQWIFLYDSESVVALCLISFVTIFYWNFKESVEQLLLEKGESLNAEVTGLYKGTSIFVKKMEYFWVIFLDMEDALYHFTYYLKTQAVYILNKWVKTRNKFMNLLIKNDLFLINKNKLKLKLFLYYIVNIHTKKKLNTKNWINLFNFETFVNQLNKLSINSTSKHYIINKLNFSSNIKRKKHLYFYNSYIYLLLVK